MEQKITSNDKKFYWALIIAILALLIGATGLILSFQKGNTTLEPVTSGSPTSADQMPPGVTGQPDTVEIHPDGKQGVVESEKKK